MFQKNYNKITQRQLQTRIIKRKPKEIYIFPEKYKKILMILDLYNSIIMEYQKCQAIQEINQLNSGQKIGLK